MNAPELRKRFESKIRRGSSECWEWTASKRQNGYGQIGIINGKSPAYAHRVAYELYIGPIPDGMYVCHRCDNRSCVNPDHLFVGTPAANMQDAKRKGRLANKKDHHGTRNPRAKLTADQVAAIRSAWVPFKVTMPQLAAQYGVCRSAITRILQGKSWTRS